MIQCARWISTRVVLFQLWVPRPYKINQFSSFRTVPLLITLPSKRPIPEKLPRTSRNKNRGERGRSRNGECLNTLTANIFGTPVPPKLFFAPAAATDCHLIRTESLHETERKVLFRKFGRQADGFCSVTPSWLISSHRFHSCESVWTVAPGRTDGCGSLWAPVVAEKKRVSRSFVGSYASSSTNKHACPTLFSGLIYWFFVVITIAMHIYIVSHNLVFWLSWLPVLHKSLPFVYLDPSSLAVGKKRVRRRQQ